MKGKKMSLNGANLEEGGGRRRMGGMEGGMGMEGGRVCFGFDGNRYVFSSTTV